MTTSIDLSPADFESMLLSLFHALEYECVTPNPPIDAEFDIKMYDGSMTVLVWIEFRDIVETDCLRQLMQSLEAHREDGPIKGLIVTPGTISHDAENYLSEMRNAPEPYSIEILTGDDIHRLGAAVGLDFYHGSTDIECRKSLPLGNPSIVVREVFSTLRNAPSRIEVPEPTTTVTLLPAIDVETRTQASFKGNDAIIHDIDKRDHFVIIANNDKPSVAPESVVSLMGVEPVPIHEVAANQHEIVPFSLAEGQYEEWIRTYLCDQLEQTIEYTGASENTLSRICRPAPSDVRIGTFRPIYIPHVSTTVEIGHYTYNYSYFAAGDRHVTITDEIHQCVQCDAGGPYTFCNNCGSIHCATHIKKERLVGDPVCASCAVTDEVFFQTKYFYSEENRQTFRDEFEELPVYRQALENPQLVSTVAGILLLLVAVLMFKLI